MRASLPGLAAALVIGLLAGIIIGRPSTDDHQPEGPAQSATVADQNCPKYKDMYDRLRVDYLTLQDDRSKNRSVAVCPETKGALPKSAAIAEKPAPAVNFPAPSADEDPYDVEPETADEVPVTKEQPTGNSVPNDEAVAFIASIKSIEKDMGNTETPAKKFKFLDRVKLKTPMQTTDSMQPVSEKDKFFEKIFGVFKAPIQFTDKKRKNGRIILVIKQPENPEDKKAWVVRVDVDDGRGKVSRQNGGLEMLRTVSDQSLAYFIRSSENSYLQLFYRSSSDQFLGNYYEKNNSGDYPKRGTFWLIRQNP